MQRETQPMQHLEAKYTHRLSEYVMSWQKNNMTISGHVSRPGHFDQLQMFTVQPLFPHHLQQVSRLDIHLKKQTKEIEIQPVLEWIFWMLVRWRRSYQLISGNAAGNK